MRPRPGQRDSVSSSTPRVLLAIIPLLGFASLVVLWQAPSLNRREATAAEESPASTSTAVSVASTFVEPFYDGPVYDFRGALPDGTRFHIYSPGLSIDPVDRISGTIVMDVEPRPTSPQPAHVVGVVEYLPVTTEFRDYGRGFVLLPAGEWTIRIDIPDSATSVLGDDPEQVLLAGIEVWTVNDMPALKLAPPLRWADDDEGSVPLEVATPQYVISRGCDASAVGCSVTRAVQLHLSPPFIGDASVPRSVSINAYEAARPTTDPGYLNPGPLSFRYEPHLVWTGQELIVWGGSHQNSGTLFTDGAAFAPETGAWRFIPGPPLVGPDLTAAVWADDRMLVVSRQATLAYHPDSDSWIRLGDGPPYVARSPGMTVWTGELVATWAPLGIHVFDPDVDLWTTLPDPGFNPIPWGGALRVVDGRLFAIGSYCQRVAEWMGTTWRPLPDRGNLVGPSETCPTATRSGVAGGRLILWGDDEGWAAAYDPRTDSWSPISSPPHPLSEGWDTGSLDIGGRLVVPVGQYANYDQFGQLVRVDPIMYDVATDQWLPVDLPGPAGMQLVWTGEEVLSWGGCCWGSVVDAWRWRPPEG